MADQPPPIPIIERPIYSVLNLSAAFIVLRLFMGFRLVLSGLEKMGYFVGKGTASLEEALTLRKWIGDGGLAANDGFGDGKMWPVGKAMLDYTFLPKVLIQAILIPLPYLMIVPGVFILLGLFNRAAWWLAGMVWFSLAFGQMLLPDEGTVQTLGLYIVITAIALVIIEHNRLRVTKF
ncbi:MAG: hypothetical protein ACR2OZ_08415 [Verrucomicrobiales bacterium]